MAGSSDILPDGVLDSGDKSKINIAYIFLFFNVQIPLERIIDAHLNGNFMEWRKLLDRFFIDTEMLYTDKERDAQKEEIKKVNDAFNNIFSLSDCVGRENKLREALGTYEIFLRRTANKHDMLLPKKDSRWIM